MKANKHYVAFVEVVLIWPAALFMTSLLIRQLTASSFGAAAQSTVMWYAERRWTLWLLLVTLPLVSVVVGCATLMQDWKYARLRSGLSKSLAANSDGSAMFVAALAFVAAIIVVIVGLHILAN